MGKKSHQWVRKFLHGLSWNSGNYPYWFLFQTFIAIKLRFLSGKFYAKGKEKTESLQTLLRREVIESDTLLCPKVEEIVTPILPVLYTLFFCLRNKRKDIALKEKQLYFYWLALPANEPSSGESSSFSFSSEFISKFDSIQLNNE